MEEYFLEYLLNGLDDRTRGEVEAYVAEHPAASGKLALLRQGLAPLAVDADAPEPPPLLVERTLARVAEHVCAKDRARDDLPQAPPVSRSSAPVGRSWWRRADVMIAASVVVTVVGIGLIVLGKMRGPSSAEVLVGCKNNLREFHVALTTYHQQNRKFPDVGKEESPRDVAGMFVPILQDAGTLSKAASTRCPGVGGVPSSPVSLAALRAMSPADFEQHAACLSLCYAYSLGYRDDTDVYHGPGDQPESSWSQTPILSDRPPAEGLFLNSVNHGGAGQNVLFADGSVRFLPNRSFGIEDDIFVNRAREVAAGLDATDTVLGNSAARVRNPGGAAPK